MKKIIFVYGTLKKGCCNHHVLEPLIGEQRPVPFTSVEKYPMYKDYHQYFPYLENQPGIGERVEGELYEIDEKDEHILDHFEGVPNLYKKGTIKVINGNIEYDANCYFKSDETEDLSKVTMMTEWVEKKFNMKEYLKSMGIEK